MGNGGSDPTSSAIFPRQWCRPFRAENHGGIQPGALPRAIVSRPFRAAKTPHQNPTRTRGQVLFHASQVTAPGHHRQRLQRRLDPRMGNRGPDPTSHIPHGRGGHQQLHRNCNLPPQRGSPCQPRATPWEQIPKKFKALKGRSNRRARGQVLFHASQVTAPGHHRQRFQRDA